MEDESPPPAAPSPYDQVELFEVTLEAPLVTRTWDELRTMFDLDDSELRRWVRYGCPFVEAGPLDATSGCTFSPGHLFRWLALFTSYLDVRGLLPSEAERRGTGSVFVPRLEGASF